MRKHFFGFLISLALACTLAPAGAAVASISLGSGPGAEIFHGPDGLFSCVDAAPPLGRGPGDATLSPAAASDDCVDAGAGGFAPEDAADAAAGVDERDYVVYLSGAYDVPGSCEPGLTASPGLAIHAADWPSDDPDGTEANTGRCDTPDHLFFGPGTDSPEVPIVVNRKVRWFIKYFQTDARDYFEKWLARTGSFEGLIKGILSDEGMPEDLFYLAMIESGLNPMARSRADAVGIWQFMAPTAKRHGLRVDWWIDERRDPEKATRAAASYLRSMYDSFDSWYLAAAGYNGGENRVKRAIKAYNSTDFWELARYNRAFKKETRNYVPKYLAAMIIAKDPEAFGFTGLEYGADFSYDKVNISQATDLRVIARAAEVPVGELKRLNPELLHWFTPPDYPDYEIRLPKGTATVFAANFEKIPPPERLRFHRHRIRRGETLSEIAVKYNTRVRLIVYLNDLKDPRFIRAGRTIIVPVRAKGYAADRTRTGG